MIIRNLTPHSIVWRRPDGTEKIYPVDGQPARVVMGQRAADPIIDADGEEIPARETWTEPTVIGLPDKSDKTIIIVSRMVCDALPDRDDLWTTGGTIRDDDGNIRACTRLEHPVAAPVKSLET